MNLIDDTINYMAGQQRRTPAHLNPDQPAAKAKVVKGPNLESPLYPLFKLMREEHRVLLLEDDMQQIISCCEKILLGRSHPDITYSGTCDHCNQFNMLRPHDPPIDPTTVLVDKCSSCFTDVELTREGDQA